MHLLGGLVIGWLAASIMRSGEEAGKEVGKGLKIVMIGGAGFAGYLAFKHFKK